MALATRLSVSLPIRYTRTAGSRYRQGLCCGGSESAQPPATEKTAVDLELGARVGGDVDDAVLVRAALVGQVWAQRGIWSRFAPMVYRFSRRTLGPRYDHDDLTQEVFLRVFRNLHSIEKVSAISSFVYSVAVRVVSQEIRRFAWRRRITEEVAAVSTCSTASPADFEVRETLMYIQETLDRMRDKYRATFILRYVDGMGLEQIALGLGISETTVKRYLAKALASIHRSVSKRESEGHRHKRRTMWPSAIP